MKSLFVFFTLVAVAFAGHHQFKCDGVDITVPEDVKSVGKGCIDRFFPEASTLWAKFKSGEIPKPSKDEMKAMFDQNKSKMNCASVCKGNGLGTINGDGKVDLGKLEELFGKMIPSADIVKNIMSGVGACISAQPNLTFNEANCEANASEAASMKECVMNSFKTACKF